ncbi:MAG: SRPBCC domain-containing protein [Gulosibacter sp.]|uniref:SRPBCC domain-containing protein n=1 Tax=Gulosibacter sp. TaxID=2817531 RepID=UPI003F8DB772
MTVNPPIPTGTLVSTDSGHNLVIDRVLSLSREKAWSRVTVSEHTAQWIGKWEGNGAVGETIRLQLGFEETAPWSEVKITECEAPTRIRVVTQDDFGAWDLSIELRDAGERTELQFVMHNVDPAQVGNIGPGWEYYLDQLEASIADAPLPNFDDYFPSQRGFYEAQAR